MEGGRGNWGGWAGVCDRCAGVLFIFLSFFCLYLTLPEGCSLRKRGVYLFNKLNLGDSLSHKILEMVNTLKRNVRPNDCRNNYNRYFFHCSLFLFLCLLF